MTKTRIVAVIALLALQIGSALALDLERKNVAAFIDEMVSEHNFDRAELSALLKNASTQQSILDAISRPAEKSKQWHEYRDIFITDKRIDAGVTFWAEHADTIQQISEKTGVPGEILVGIIGVETYYGRITGKYRVLDALATLSFDYPPRSKFFRRELVEFLLLSRDEALDPNTALGSYAGAMGSPQFIPSSYRAYAIDADNDGQRDLFANWHDIIGSVANYFIRHGWQEGMPVTASANKGEHFRGKTPAKNKLKPYTTVAALSAKGLLFSTDQAGDAATTLITFEGKQGKEYWVGFDNFYVITRYNHSAMYAMAVWQLGNEIAQRRSTVLSAQAEQQ